MTQFTDKQQRQFLQFITGCPKLPFGGKVITEGFKKINPKLTVVKKTGANSDQSVDQILPSVMT